MCMGSLVKNTSCRAWPQLNHLTAGLHHNTWKLRTCAAAATAVTVRPAGPSVKTIQFSGSFFTVYPERVTWTEAARTCQQLPNGKLAILGSQGLVEAVSRDLLDTLPFQTAVRSAWVGAKGSNTAYRPDAPNITLLTAGVTTHSLVPQTQLMPGNATESTLTWIDGAPVVHGVLRRPDSLVQLWTAHDVVWSQQYVPQSAHDVCGRVIIQLPPSMGPVDPTSVLPGIWYYDCNKPAAFICQSACFCRLLGILFRLIQASGWRHIHELETVPSRIRAWGQHHSL